METLRRPENMAEGATNVICMSSKAVIPKKGSVDPPEKPLLASRLLLSVNLLEEFSEYRKLSVRCRNRLRAHGIVTLEQLLEVSDEELMGIAHFGVKCLEEVRTFCATFPDEGARFKKAVAMQKKRTGSKHLSCFDLMDASTRECLSEVGISDGATLHESNLSDVMDALMYDPECLYEVWINCGLPSPADADELLQIACILVESESGVEQVLDISDQYSSRLARLSDLTRRRIQEGSLHPQAFMSFMPLQSRNSRLKPPARDILELLDRAERGAVKFSGRVLESLEESLENISVGRDLDALLTILNEREIHVLRYRCAPVRETLGEIAAQLGVSRERVRQIQETVENKLKESYRNGTTLAGFRSAQLFLAKERSNSEEQIETILRSRNLIEDGDRIRDFIAVWNGVDKALGSGMDTLVRWKILDEKAFRFPEDLRLSLTTGYTKAQEKIEKILMPQVRKRLGRSGFFRLSELVGQVFRGNPPETTNVEYVLSKNGCEPIGGGCWIGPDSGKDVPGRIVRKMLYYCGDLDSGSLHYGFARHQSRLGYPVPPLYVLQAMLERRSYVRELEDGRFQLVSGVCDIPKLAKSESTWMELVREHGPVITFGQISNAFERVGLTRMSAAMLCARSALVVKLRRDRYYLPGEVAGLSDEVVPPEGNLPDLPNTALQGDEVDGILHGRIAITTKAPYALNLCLPESRWPGRVAVTLEWEEDEIPVRTRYLAGEDVTIAGNQYFPMRQPDWNVFATLTDGNTFMKVVVPSVPEKRSVLFLASNGRKVSNWRGVLEHLVLMPENLFDEQDAELLFEFFEVLEMEQGYTEDHLLLKVRVRRSIEGCSLREIEEAAHRLGMPGLSRLHRTEARLIGPHTYEPDVYNPFVRSGVFTTTDPPLLEISGCGDDPVCIELYGETTGDGDAGEVMLGSVDVALDGTSRIVEVFSEEPVAGRYRARVPGCRDLTFRVAAPGKSERDSPPVDIGVDISECGDLIVKAWPHASLDLSMTSGGSVSSPKRIRVDEHGEWRGNLKDLRASSLMPGAKISVSWKGMMMKSFPLFASATRPEARFVWREFSDENPLVLEQETSEDTPEISCGDETYILGRRPWLGEVWEPTVRNIPGSGRRVVVKGAVEPEWSVEIEGYDPRRATVNRIENSRRAKECWFGAEDILGVGAEDEGGIESWHVLRDVLREQTLSPDLKQKLGVGDLRDTLKQCIEKFPCDPVWRPLTEELLTRLVEWKRYGLELPVVPFVFGKGPANETGTKPGFTTLNVDVTELMEDRTTRIVMSSNQNEWKTGNRVIRNPGDSGNQKMYRLEAGEHLCACLNCGRYMPQSEFRFHQAMVKGQGNCNGIGKSFRTVTPGEAREVDLMVLLDPEAMLLASIRLVLSDVREEETPEFAEDWLEILVEEAPDNLEDVQDFEFWLEAVCENLISLKGLSEKLASERMRGSHLAHLGRSSLPYRGCMELLSDWISSEMEVR